VVDGPIGGDLGYLKYAVFRGDNGTFSVTLALQSDDKELRSLLLDPERFDRAATQLPPTAPWVDGRSDAITGVHVMAGLINRLRRFTLDGRPLSPGLFAVGDANICTNPLYGRGCSLGFVMAFLLAETIGEPEPELAYDAAVRREVEPWYDASVTQDRENREAAEARRSGVAEDEKSFMKSVFMDGLRPAMRTDPVVWRAFTRTFNLLCPPDTIVKDPDVINRVIAVWQDRDNRPPEPALGPPRKELLRNI
jgi:flavin-dependent dehydrogenase